MKRILFIFRRDLRLEDNTGLIFAAKNAEECVIPAFVFTEEQLDPDKNAYKSQRCVQFMLESLADLKREIEARKGRLYFFYGKSADEIVDKCLDELPTIDGIVLNKDYTPYSLARDEKIRQICDKRKIGFHSFDDLLLYPLDETLKADGTPYTVFTPFYRNALKLEKPSKPVKNDWCKFFKEDIQLAQDFEALRNKILPVPYEKQQPGGRKAALEILAKIENFKNYSKDREVLANEGGTTHLSPHLKFSTVSIREAYHVIADKLGAGHALLRQLYWRDFYVSVAFRFPKVFAESFRSKFNNLEWSSNEDHFTRWCRGRTGVPIVDAGMRQMNETGFMHNRARMIVACFLVKELHIDWRRGEKYFAQNLLDYDPAVNNGNWQWSASTGCDAQPYFRIFNPWLQSPKFDRHCSYVKKWVPELAEFEPDVIHQWYWSKHYKKGADVQYPPPMVDHTKETKIAIATYKKCA